MITFSPYENTACDCLYVMEEIRDYDEAIRLAKIWKNRARELESKREFKSAGDCYHTAAEIVDGAVRWMQRENRHCDAVFLSEMTMNVYGHAYCAYRLSDAQDRAEHIRNAMQWTQKRHSTLVGTAGDPIVYPSSDELA